MSVPTGRSRRPRSPLALSVAAGALAVLTGCSSGSSTPAAAPTPQDAVGTESIAGTFDQAAADLLPADVAESGVIVSSGAPGYAPFYLQADDGETLVGSDPELLRAAADVLGVEVRFEPIGFDAQIPALQSQRTDMASGAFSITPDRLAAVDFVSYFAGGTSLVVPTGNPLDIGLDTMCGRKVAVQLGTVYADDYLPVFTAECEAAGEEPIDVSVFPTQPDATLALSTGRADASMSDYGPLTYVAERSNGRLEVLQENYDPSTWGYGFPKGSALAPAVAAALNVLIADGTYGEILAKWGVSDGAVTTSEVVTGAEG